jgi:putative transposase
VKVKQAYKFALDPAPVQERMLRSHAGAARFAWNWGLAKCAERYEAEGKWYSAIDLHKLWNAGKKADPALSWWSGNSKCAYQEAFRDLDRALRDFVKSRKGERRGKRLGFPRFKKRGKARDSFRFGAGVMRCSGSTVTLPRLGTLRTHESTRKLARRLENGTARILSATVSRCEPCGLVIGRDVNAARNLLNLAASGAESRNACGGTVRPGRAGQVPVNQEPGIPNGSQTGTASGQLEAVA